MDITTGTYKIRTSLTKRNLDEKVMPYALQSSAVDDDDDYDK